MELGVTNASIHKVNESVGVDEIDALHQHVPGIAAPPAGLTPQRAWQRGARPVHQHAQRCPAPPRQISTQAGIDRPRKVQSTFAHSPEPVSTLRSTSMSGKHVQHVVEGGAACRHLAGRQRLDVQVAAGHARARQPRPGRSARTAIHAQHPQPSGTSAASRKATPSATTAMRWKMHSGQGSSPS